MSKKTIITIISSVAAIVVLAGVAFTLYALQPASQTDATTDDTSTPTATTEELLGEGEAATAASDYEAAIEFYSDAEESAKIDGNDIAAEEARVQRENAEAFLEAEKAAETPELTEGQ